jgi:uncharacterized membrane protein YgcG
MKYLYNFQKHQEVNEGLKNWLSSFLILTTLGLVPPSVVLSQDNREKKEFVEKIDKAKLEAALFVDYLNKLDITRPDLVSTFSEFKSKNPEVTSKFEDIEGYVNRSGRKFMFNQKYIQNDYSAVDITKFQPANYLTDMANIIEDSQEPVINNWISDYEKQTSVEIGVITINRLPEDENIDDYALTQFRRIGVGKRGVNNGILIVISKEDRKWSIKTGYGVEGVLTDYDCSNIGHDSIVPYFRKGNYYSGIISALGGIKSVIGTDEIESKKEWIQKKKQADDKASAEFWNNFLDITLKSLAALLVISLIAYYTHKKNQKIKAEKKRKEDEEREIKRIETNISRILNSIKELKSKIPNSNPTGSKSLDSIIESCKQYVDNIHLSDIQYNKDSEIKLTEILNRVIYLLGNVTQKSKQIKDFKSDVSRLSEIESNSYQSLERALQNAKKISDYGFQTDSVPSKTELDSLHLLIPQIMTTLDSDIDKAMSIYNQYTSNLSNIEDKSRKIATKLSSIESAITRIKNWKSEINTLVPKFLEADGTKIKLNSMISGFEAKLDSKDWIMLTFELDKITSFMKSIINEHEDRLRRKREEERRKKKEEEEEEERRRSYSSSYSSSSYDSSSSSSFGGFGGGDSGGGGSSGDW